MDSDFDICQTTSNFRVEFPVGNNTKVRLLGREYDSYSAPVREVTERPINM